MPWRSASLLFSVSTFLFPYFRSSNTKNKPTFNFSYFFFFEQTEEGWASQNPTAFII
jgi:hypothetical protein